MQYPYKKLVLRDVLFSINSAEKMTEADMRIYYLKSFRNAMKKKSTFITTNKAFTEWGDIFPNAACVVSIIDRLVHHSDIVNIEADSYRLKEAKEKQQKKSNKTKLKPIGETR